MVLLRDGLLTLMYMASFMSLMKNILFLRKSNLFHLRYISKQNEKSTPTKTMIDLSAVNNALQDMISVMRVRLENKEIMFFLYT